MNRDGDLHGKASRQQTLPVDLDAPGQLHLGIAVADGAELIVDRAQSIDRRSSIVRKVCFYNNLKWWAHQDSLLR